MKLCTCKPCQPWRGRTVDLGRIVLTTVCKDRQEISADGKPTGLTVTWKPGGWTLHDQQGHPLADGGIDGRGGFSARHTDGGRVLRDRDQFALIGRVAAKYVTSTSVKEAA